MKQARLLRLAEHDLDRAMNHYNEAAVDLGYAFAAEVKRSLSVRVADLPKSQSLGRVEVVGYRRRKAMKSPNMRVAWPTQKINIQRTTAA